MLRFQTRSRGTSICGSRLPAALFAAVAASTVNQGRAHPETGLAVADPGIIFRMGQVLVLRYKILHRPILPVNMSDCPQGYTVPHTNPDEYQWTVRTPTVVWRGKHRKTRLVAPFYNGYISLVLGTVTPYSFLWDSFSPKSLCSILWLSSPPAFLVRSPDSRTPDTCVSHFHQCALRRSSSEFNPTSPFLAAR